MGRDAAETALAAAPRQHLMMVGATPEERDPAAVLEMLLQSMQS